MEPGDIQRKLAVIVAADVEGFLDGLRKTRLPVSIAETAYRGGANVGV